MFLDGVVAGQIDEGVGEGGELEESEDGLARQQLHLPRHYLREEREEDVEDEGRVAADEAAADYQDGDADVAVSVDATAGHDCGPLGDLAEGEDGQGDDEDVGSGRLHDTVHQEDVVQGLALFVCRTEGLHADSVVIGYLEGEGC